ncbi:DUF1178 family protein [Polaromonas sp. YR568]|uniref:DUF1178 family protein n=1 Tax=Polaromonas sp. YR568 TaxID=1855301 RepID=UPI003137DC8F
MKVLNLQCAHQHAFEGWFASEDDFQSQRTRGLIACPLCADTAIRKLPSAPRLNLGSSPPVTETVSQPAADAPGTALAVTNGQNAPLVPGMSPAQQAAFLQALRQVVAQTEDVGEKFAEEARRMHYGDAEARNIRGQTSAREAMELLDEGIEVLPLPLPALLKETLQ